MRHMTLEDGGRLIREAFELMQAGKMTAKEYSVIFFRVGEDTTAHPVRWAGV